MVVVQFYLCSFEECIGETKTVVSLKSAPMNKCACAHCFKERMKDALAAKNS